MKKIITSAFLAFALCTANAAVIGNVTTEATEFARQLVSQVQLNEMEYIKVRALTIEKLEKTAEIRSMFGSNPEVLAQKIAETEKYYNDGLQQILNPKQFAGYVAFSNSLKTGAAATADAAE
jgi:hypothetical protein